MSQHAPYVWDFFYKKIKNPFGVAGLMGNLKAESGLLPNRVQGSFDTNYDYIYTTQVDSGAISEYDFVHNGPNGGGYGLAQWTFSARKQALYDMYKSGGYSSIGSIELACDYLWYELRTAYSSVLNVLKKAKTLREASDRVLYDFESPADQSNSVAVYRAGLGYEYLSTYGNGYGNSEELAIIDKAVNWAVSIANDNTHGYSQNRPDYPYYNNPNWPDYDCASLLTNAWEYAGVHVIAAGATYTKNFASGFLKCGFHDVTSLVNFETGAGLLRGDILLNPDHHVEMMVSENERVGAHSDYGFPESGDQTGTEIDVRPYANYTHGWTICLRYGNGYVGEYQPFKDNKFKLLFYAAASEMY